MTRPHRRRIYLAGPEVFLPNARLIGAEKCQLAADAGLEGAFPLDAQLNLGTLPAGEQAQRISRANEDLMRSCDGLIANLTPFRGVSMDAGTAFEVGFMQALGRPLAGYTNVAAGYAERARAFRARGPATMDSDRLDLEIEDFGLAENLMIEVAILSSGGRVVRRQVVAGTELTDTAGFAQCLADMAERFART
jgi:nucleoside 2-deoxyribosyltransferase